MDKTNLSPDWLQTTLLFQGLSQSQLQAVMATAQVQTYGKNELVFKRGEPAIGFFVVKTGRVRIFNFPLRVRSKFSTFLNLAKTLLR